MGKPVLYHGSSLIVEKPVFGKGKENNDYGRGFYCTEHIELAKEWSCGENTDGFVRRYSPDTTDLNILHLSDEMFSVLNRLATLVKNRRARLSTDGDGTVNDTTAVAYGETPSHADGSKAADAQYTYTFTGWTPTIEAVTGNATYTAQFSRAAISYSITYELNGGSATNPTSYTAETDTFTLNNPTKDGYIFAGWTGSNGETPSTAVTITKGSTGDLRYTANWELDKNNDNIPDKYQRTITFTTVNGKMGDVAEKTFVVTLKDASDKWSEDGTATLTAPTVTADDGYTADGCAWAPAYNSTIGKGSATAYTFTCAKETYSITYNLDGGSAANPTSYTVETETFTLTNPTRDGYVFAGWTGSNGETPSTAVTITKGTTGDLRYTANWELDKNNDNIPDKY